MRGIQTKPRRSRRIPNEFGIRYRNAATEEWAVLHIKNRVRKFCSADEARVVASYMIAEGVYSKVEIFNYSNPAGVIA